MLEILIFIFGQQEVEDEVEAECHLCFRKHSDYCGVWWALVDTGSYLCFWHRCIWDRGGGIWRELFRETQGLVMDLLLEWRKKVVLDIVIHNNREPWKIRFEEKNHDFWVKFDPFLRHPKPMLKKLLAYTNWNNEWSKKII